MRRANGEIVTWLNSDDRLAPGALAAVALAFRNSGADIVAGLCTVFDERGPQFQHMPALRPGLLSLSDLLDRARFSDRGHFFYQPEVMFTRAIWDACGGALDENLHFVMDYELWCRFAAQGATIDIIGRPVAELRLHDKQKTHGLHAVGRADPRIAIEADRIAAAYRRKYAISAPPPFRASARRGTGRILAVNDIGFRFGAGIAHRRLIEAVQYAGQAVDVLTIGSEATIGIAEQSRTFPRLLAEASRSKPDLVLAGNIHGATRMSAVLEALAQVAPVAVVMHDFFLVTGRCAHRGECTLAATGCDDRCPTPNVYPQLRPDRIATAWAEKRAFLASAKAPLLLANSAWTFAEARACLGSASPATRLGTIRLPFPAHRFRPRDKARLRSRLSLPTDAFIVAFANATMADLRKGVPDILEALRLTGRGDVVGLAIGLTEGRASDGASVIGTGHLADESHVAEWLAAADVVVSASRAETFGQTMVEAALCGVPSVAYALTGLTDAVVHEQTGLLVEPSPSGLAAGLRRLFDDPDLRRNLGAFARIHAESRYSHAAAYHSLRTALVDGGVLDESVFGVSIVLTRAYALTWSQPEEQMQGQWSANNPDAPGWLYRVSRSLVRQLWRNGVPRWLALPARMLRRLP